MPTAHVQLCQTQGQAGDKLRPRSWVEVQLVGEDDAPIGGVKYAVALPGGTIKDGTLDDNGMVRLENVPPGVCKVSFPELDKDAWTPVETQAAAGSDAGADSGTEAAA
jgi:hypothetical protein